MVVSANEARGRGGRRPPSRASGGERGALRRRRHRKADVGALYDAAEAAFGRVDISVQNAGVITIARIEDMTEAEWDTVMDGQHQRRVPVLPGGDPRACASTAAAAG